MPQIYLLRHAESEANARGILAGRDYSVNLTAKGFKDSRKIKSKLAKIDFTRVYSSPITRCVQTVTPYLDSNPRIDVTLTESLIEMDYGAWSGKKLSSLSKKKEWSLIQKRPAEFTFPNGEGFQEMRKRVKSFLNSMIDADGPILIVSHGDIIKMALTITLDLPLNKFQNFVVAPASISIIDYSQRSKSVISTNQRITDAGIISRASKFILGGESA
jgi:broad specificity phosphatase PhoE